jgi:glycine cleavage system H protein
VVYVELPPVGKELKTMQEFGVVESVKSVSSLYCPVSGKVVAVNSALNDKPEKINDSPYDDGWIIQVELSSPSDLDKLLSASEYQLTLKK